MVTNRVQFAIKGEILRLTQGIPTEIIANATGDLSKYLNYLEINRIYTLQEIDAKLVMFGMRSTIHNFNDIYDSFISGPNKTLSIPSVEYGIKNLMRIMTDLTSESSYTVLYFGFDIYYQRAISLIKYYSTIAKTKDRFKINKTTLILQTTKTKEKYSLHIRFRREIKSKDVYRHIALIYHPVIYTRNDIISLINDKFKDIIS